jgi:hypothetical protein
VNVIEKNALRTAVLIREHLATPCPSSVSIHLPDYYWNEALRLQRLIEQARRHSWHCAAARLTADLAATLENLQRDLGWAIDGLKANKAPERIAPAADLYRDILALYDEFNCVKIDVKDHVLRVTTGSITLEDVRLGCFEVCLDWRNIGKPSPYRVVALDPNPPAIDDDVTHPHVRNEQLCEGEGVRPIAAALAEGRLLDFFQLVAQILHNYGRGSGYVELDDWEGVSCEDCGRMIRSDDCYYCNRCGVTLCESCDILCESCQESHCSVCMDTCAGCQQNACRDCLATCPKCKRQFCAECREEEGNLCHGCVEKQQQLAKENQDVPPSNETEKPPAVRTRSGRARTSRRTASAAAT